MGPGTAIPGPQRVASSTGRTPQPGLQALDTLFDQMLVLFTGLLFLAIIIAVLGITNTLTLAIIERAREIGLFLRWAVVRALAQEGLGSFAVRSDRSRSWCSLRAWLA